MAKVRVHELAKELGVESKVVLAKLKEMGEFVKGPASAVAPPVARKLKAALEAEGLGGGAAEQKPADKTPAKAPSKAPSKQSPAGAKPAPRAEPKAEPETEAAKEPLDGDRPEMTPQELARCRPASEVDRLGLDKLDLTRSVYRAMADQYGHTIDRAEQTADNLSTFRQVCKQVGRELDAFVVRMVLIPALLYLMGEKSWWLPGWLDRLLPHKTGLERHLARRYGELFAADFDVLLAAELNLRLPEAADDGLVVGADRRQDVADRPDPVLRQGRVQHHRCRAAGEEAEDRRHGGGSQHRRDEDPQASEARLLGTDRELRPEPTDIGALTRTVSADFIISEPSFNGVSPTLAASHCEPETSPARKAASVGYHITRTPAPPDHRRFGDAEDRGRRVRAQRLALLAVITGVVYLAWVWTTVDWRHPLMTAAFLVAETCSLLLFAMAAAVALGERIAPDGVRITVSHEGDRRTGLLVEFSDTDKIFTNPADERTENYVTGRFG